MSETTRNIWRVAYAALVKWWPQSLWFKPADCVRAFFAKKICIRTGEHSDCILAAGAVVAKDIPDYSIAGGVSAKVIGSRLNP